MHIRLARCAGSPGKKRQRSGGVQKLAQRDIEINADGKVENAGSESDNEIKLTDDSTCQALIDNLQKGMDACEAKLASANAIITETAESGNDFSVTVPNAKRCYGLFFTLCKMLPDC